MELINSLTPPYGTSILSQRNGNELVFPMVYGKTVTVDDKEDHRTHFGLWFVDTTTGATREIEAPFYIKKRFYTAYISKWMRYWIGRGHHKGSLVYSLGIQGSWDIGHHIFMFDGEHWNQAVRENGGVMLLKVGDNHDTVRWGSPGPIQSRAILSGGNLISSDSPLRIAVDNTHAFAYDSGPESPESAEYIAMREENQRKEASPDHSSEIESIRSPSAEIINSLPEEYRAKIAEKAGYVTEFKDKQSHWVTFYRYSTREFTQFMQLQ